MNDLRLINANTIDPLSLEGVTAYGAKTEIDSQPTIDPEDLPIVKELREELERIKLVCKNWETQWNGEYQMRRTMEAKLTQYEQAEAEGRLVVLPCKVGDCVYVIPSKENYDLNELYHPENNRVYEQTVSGIRSYREGVYLMETCNGFCCVGGGNYGKTWFLTKKEAETALKERENNA